VTVCQSRLRDLAHLLEVADEAGLQAALGTIRAKRLEMFP
jgi:hypothetical protein